MQLPHDAPKYPTAPRYPHPFQYHINNSTLCRVNLYQSCKTYSEVHIAIANFVTTIVFRSQSPPEARRTVRRCNKCWSIVPQDHSNGQSMHWCWSVDVLGQIRGEIFAIVALRRHFHFESPITHVCCISRVQRIDSLNHKDGHLLIG